MNKSFVCPMLLPEATFILATVKLNASLVTVTFFIILAVKLC